MKYLSLKTPVLVLNKDTGEEKTFYSMTDAAKYIGVSKMAVSKAIRTGSNIRDIYAVERVNRIDVWENEM